MLTEFILILMPHTSLINAYSIFYGELKLEQKWPKDTSIFVYLHTT